MQKNKSEMWDIISAKKISQVVAGYKSHATKQLNAAKSKSEKTKITRQLNAKISDFVKTAEAENLAAKRHNAAVKAWATMRAASKQTAVNPAKHHTAKRKITMTKVVHKVK